MTPLSRRTILRGAGVALALPMLDAMKLAAAGREVPRRMVAIMTNQGILPKFLFPEKAGPEYETTPYLDVLKDFRRDLTVFSGVSHPQVDGGHQAEVSFLTAAPHPGRGGFRNTVSLDQFAAERIGDRTRIPSLPLLVGTEGNVGISWTASGVMVQGENRPSAVFRRLFVQGTPAEVEAQVKRLREGRSVLDFVSERAKRLAQAVGSGDRAKLDQYFASVREMETRLQKAEAWERKPKPKVDAAPPEDPTDRGAIISWTRQMFDLARLALQTDSTRIVTLTVNQSNNPTVALDGVTQGTHTLTHHGNRPEPVSMLRIVETAQMEALRDFLKGLSEAKEDGASLLDRTMVLYGSNMGNANSHDNRNLPVILAGGGFRHAGHLAFDRAHNYPLPNLFVSMLQRLGIEADRFASSTGTMRGLDPA